MSFCQVCFVELIILHLNLKSASPLQKMASLYTVQAPFSSLNTSVSNLKKYFETFEAGLNMPGCVSSQGSTDKNQHAHNTLFAAFGGKDKYKWQQEMGAKCCYTGMK